jgi:MoaA/NifB/PqqE/SkfB family radical SAM enzyme
MGGVMAGSAILGARTRRDTLGTVTLTINNLSCPHCYLQYNGRRQAIDRSVITHLFSSNFDRICIVGKEPLVDRASGDVIEEIVKLCEANGKSASLITNGLNGRFLTDFTIRRLSWIDVSLDGGERTYESYRQGSWSKLHRSILSMYARGLRELRVLHTLSKATLGSIEDTVETASALGASLIIFSPYQPTRMQGRQTTMAISPLQMLEALEPFAHDEKVYLGFDAGYAAKFIDAPRAIEMASELFGDRLSYVDADPINRGIIRVTYDGLVLTPFEAVHTDDYARIGRPVLERPLEDWFREMLLSTVERGQVH